MSQRIRLFATLAVAIACLAYVLWDVDGAKVLAALAAVRWELVPVVLLVLAGQFLLRTWRYQLILGPDRPSFRRQLEVSAVGFMALNIVPLRMGEFVRPWMLKDDGLSLGQSIAGVAAERVLDLLILLALVMLVAVSPEIPRGSIMVEGVDIIRASQAAVGAVLAVVAGGLAAVGFGGAKAARLIERVPAVGPKIARFALSFRATTAHLVVNPLVGLGALTFSILIWSGTIASAYVLLVAFDSVDVTWTMAGAAAVFTLAGSLAIPTPGFFGPFEVFCVAVLVVFDVDPDLAKTFALTWHLHIFAFNVIPGLVVLMVRGMGIGSIVRDSRQQRDAAV